MMSTEGKYMHRTQIMLEQEQHKDIPGQSRTSDDPMSIISPKG